MAQETTLRALQPDDVEAVVKVDRARSGRARTEYYGRRFRTLADDPAIVGVAAERGGTLAGFALARVLDGEFGGAAPAGVLDAVGVLPEAERQGIATALLGGVERALAARGVRELRTQAGWTEHGMAAFIAASGFGLAPRVVLERTLERPVDDGSEREEVPVRSMTERDLPAIIRLDRKVTGRDRTTYLARKAAEVLGGSSIRLSLVAELKGDFAGFLMARADFGAFGRPEPTAVLDTIGVDPALTRQGVGRALLEQLLRNVSSLRSERVVTEVAWNDLPLLGFLDRTGFAHAQRLAFDKRIG
jgi:ribosomal protein S18 acetylase RimI-like enzyme